jgi:hypothetical protein
LAKRDEIRLSPPRLLTLSPERRQAAVRLLSELVLDEAQRGHSADGVGAGESGGSVVPFPVRDAKGREAA